MWNVLHVDRGWTKKQTTHNNDNDNTLDDNNRKSTLNTIQHFIHLYDTCLIIIYANGRYISEKSSLW